MTSYDFFRKMVSQFSKAFLGNSQRVSRVTSLATNFTFFYVKFLISFE